MPLTDLEFEDECCRQCPHCYQARDMMKLGEKGHTLRFRTDTREWVHELRKAENKVTERITQAYCQADLLRKARNG